jgi:hypothetical protein
VISVGCGRAAPRARGEASEDLGLARAVVERGAGEDAAAAAAVDHRAVERALDRDAVDPQVAVGHRGRVVEVVDEADRDQRVAGGQRDGPLVGGGAGRDRGDVEDAHRLVGHLDRQPRRVGAGLLAVGAHRDLVGGGDRRGRGDRRGAAREEQPAAALHVADGGVAHDLERLGGRRGRRGQRVGDQRLGGGLVQLERQRRQAQHVGDVVEAVAAIVGGEVARRRERGAEQVADGVVVLDVVEAVQRDPARIAAVAVAVATTDRQAERTREDQPAHPLTVTRPAAALASVRGGRSAQIVSPGVRSVG